MIARLVAPVMPESVTHEHSRRQEVRLIWFNLVFLFMFIYFSALFEFEGRYSLIVCAESSALPLA